MFAKIFAFLILAICTVGFSGAAVPTATRMRLEESVTKIPLESRGAEANGPYGEGMRRGERAGYDAGFRAGSGQRHHHPNEDEGERGY
jgi:hypothetical protein